MRARVVLVVNMQPLRCEQPLHPLDAMADRSARPSSTDPYADMNPTRSLEPPATQRGATRSLSGHKRTSPSASRSNRSPTSTPPLTRLRKHQPLCAAVPPTRCLTHVLCHGTQWVFRAVRDPHDAWHTAAWGARLLHGARGSVKKERSGGVDWPGSREGSSSCHRARSSAAEPAHL